MSDQKTMSFELNQKQLDAAIAAALPGLIAGLEITYTSGRAPKGVTADVTLSQDMIREAVIVHTKKLVNASFSHFSVSFRATRGEDGLITTITASSDPIIAEQEEEVSASTQVRPTSEATKETTTVAQKTVEEVVTEEAPFEADNTAETASEAPVEEAVTADVTVEEPATVEAVSGDVQEEAPKPAQRTKLFGDLSRPEN